MKIFRLILMVSFFSITARSQMTDDEAKAAAVKLWGTAGFIRHVGQNYQIGCQISGNTIVVESSKNSYADAFSRVNMKTNGAHMVSATVRSDTGETADSPPVAVLLCNP